MIEQTQQNHVNHIDGDLTIQDLHIVPQPWLMRERGANRRVHAVLRLVLRESSSPCRTLCPLNRLF
jgi:hypothetical protein